MKIEFKILGPPELSGNGARGARLSPQLWGLLASLLMAEGRPVPIDSLVDHLWAWDPPQMASATIRTYVSRINRSLVPGGARISSRAGGYQLAVDPQNVDLHGFRSLRRQAESVAGSGDLSHAAALLRQAEELWRGPALMGLSGDWVSARRLALDEERHEAVKLRISFELDLGRQASVLRELRELSGRYPLDEEVARELMIALYRLGRQDAAAAAGREISERFAEAGIEPGPQLRDLHLRILRGDFGLGITPAYRSTGPDPQPNSLPLQAPDFVGRTAEIERLTAGCQGNAPLVEVIAGMPGVGKTALAVHVAHRMTDRYPDAQLFVPIAGAGPDGAEEALQRLLRMLGVPAARIPAGTAERARLWQAEIAFRRAVIVLDNAPGPEQVSLIVPTAGDSLTIITSLQQAGWPGQRVLRLHPLVTADSVTLLRSAAGPAAGQDADKAATAASLCSGLPLTIRVAAGRLREGDLPDLDSLIGELRDIHAGRGSAESGRRVFSAFEPSYRQLTAEGQRMFRLLAACPCADFGLDAAAALTGQARTDAAASIEALCARSLLERGPAGRFRFHDLIRPFAATRRAEQESETESQAGHRRAIRRLIQYYSDTLNAAAAADYASSQQPGNARTGHGQVPAQFHDPDSAHAWLESEWRNIVLVARHAAGHERHRQAADLTHSLAGFLQAAGYWSDAIAAHEAALRACRMLGDPARTAKAAVDLSTACRRGGDGVKARRHADEALSAFAALGDRQGQADALNQLGFVCQSAGTARDGLAYHQEAADLYRESGDRRGTARAIMGAAGALASLGRYPEAADNLEHALALFRQAGDRRGEARCLNNMGAVLEDRGLHRHAVAHYEQSIAIFRETRERANLTLLEHNLGNIKHYKGDHDEAIMIFRKVLTMYSASGDLHGQAAAMSDIGDAFAGKECYSEALVHHQKSAGLAKAIGDKRQLAAALCGMGNAHRGSGSYQAAIGKYQEAHRLAAGIEAPYLNGRALYGLAETLLITKGTGAAKIYWRQAYDIFTQLGVREAATVELRLHSPSAAAS